MITGAKLEMMRTSRYRKANILSGQMAKTFEVARKARKNWFTTRRLREEGIGSHQTANKLVEMGLLVREKVPGRGCSFTWKYKWNGKKPDIPCGLCAHVVESVDAIKRTYHQCSIHDMVKVDSTWTCKHAADPNIANGGANQWL